MIELVDVTKNIAGNTIINKVNLTINENDFLSITGKSGSGKTTLLNILALESSLSGGYIIFDRQKILTQKEMQLTKHRIGRIFQDFKLIPDLTIFENVSYLLENDGTLNKLEITEIVISALDLLGILEIQNEFPDNVSGGQQQRVGIARCIARGNKIIIADEPTSNLDPQTSKNIFEVLRKVNQLGIPVIVATHDVDLIKNYSTRNIRLSGGTIVEWKK
ncbi:MAG: ATP-binding cassette domain-containing protein [Streptococcaceae bacterium]|jgi:ABC-type ATPase involved in cell division|nr:ATP-binding cassette domain-containing protein [Streptococcaceae bacterium]